MTHGFMVDDPWPPIADSSCISQPYGGDEALPGFVDFPLPEPWLSVPWLPWSHRPREWQVRFGTHKLPRIIAFYGTPWWLLRSILWLIGFRWIPVLGDIPDSCWSTSPLSVGSWFWTDCENWVIAGYLSIDGFTAICYASISPKQLSPLSWSNLFTTVARPQRWVSISHSSGLSHPWVCTTRKSATCMVDRYSNPNKNTKAKFNPNVAEMPFLSFLGGTTAIIL